MKDILRDHKSFVQGVAWDPAGQYLATLSSDRICRIFNVSNQKIVSRVGKALLPNAKADTKPVHLFHDDTLKSFFRRLCFTPCGSLLIAPAGIIEPQEQGKKAVNTTLVFTRNSLSRPVAYLPSYNQYSVAVRCCPKLFALRDAKEPPLFNLPYRVVFAIATQSSVVLYDTQHYCPIAFIANIHYTRLTDLTWSSDGKILIVSSTDGYCSIITFSENELGEPYVPNKGSESSVTNDKEKKCNEDSPKSIDNNSDMDCCAILNSSPESSSNKADEKSCKFKDDGSFMKLPKESVASKNYAGKSSKDVTIRQESATDDTNDYCLVLEETVNDSVTVGITSLGKENEMKENNNFDDKTETLVTNKNEEIKCIDVASCFSKLTTLNDKLVEKEKDNSQKTKDSKTLESTAPIEHVSNKSENISNTCLRTPSKDPSNSSTSSTTPVSSVGLNKNCTPPLNITPIEQRKPKRAQLITLSSPKSKKKL